ncbi:hypothetical protein [Bdellovibrio bacteriovorus]|uniref:Uncharacterized protein n=1 Tax=Bdellovibrio bacteriovorus TaxID=959 RepID=A0A161PQS7_BDEBC|nr:hypothetical protein [Bdellovibrio bacteriovorus]KYG69033.1 hypothetical protein AZI87_07350 [Bdellovibrio bacteriovorus]
MKSVILSAALMLSVTSAQAESIYCTFTEPFLSVSYNSDTNKVKITSPDNGGAELNAIVKYKQGGVIRFEVEGLTQYLDLYLNKEGSDGMSDFIYPFEGVISEQLYGGCETDSLKKRMP